MTTDCYELYDKDKHDAGTDHAVQHLETNTIGITNSAIVTRCLHIVVLAVCYFVLELIAKILVGTQLLFVVWRRKPHPGMQRLGTMIAEYMHDLWRYCTFASDQSPWPFRR